MKYTQKQSLEHIALVKIVVTLWMLDDVRDLISNISVSPFCIWRNIEKRVTEKVSQLQMPELLKEKIICFIKPIGLQILKWINYHCTDRYLQIDFPNELCWTSQGTIDRRKTAVVLIKDGNVDIIKRYKLACIYCLKNDIRELWDNIPESRREFLSFEDYSDTIQEFIWLYWTHTMEAGYSDPYYPSKSTVESCAKDGNKAATEYFLEELTPGEREESLLKSAQEEDVDSEVLCFLISQMDEEQQKEVFERNPYKVLMCFLDWPLQHFFTEVANSVWGFLYERYFDRLLERIVVKIRDGYKDYNYEKLFETFWQKSPSTFKSYVTGECCGGFLMPYLLRIKDKSKMKFILQDANREEKKAFIYCIKVQYTFQDLICNEEWDFLRFLIDQCLPSKSEMMKFKNEFERHVTRCSWKDNFTRNKEKWDLLFLPPDLSVCESSKRKYTEEVETHQFKRSRCTQ